MSVASAANEQLAYVNVSAPSDLEKLIQKWSKDQAPELDVTLPARIAFLDENKELVNKDIHCHGAINRWSLAFIQLGVVPELFGAFVRIPDEGGSSLNIDPSNPREWLMILNPKAFSIESKPEINSIKEVIKDNLEIIYRWKNQESSVTEQFVKAGDKNGFTSKRSIDVCNSAMRLALEQTLIWAKTENVDLSADKERLSDIIMADPLLGGARDIFLGSDNGGVNSQAIYLIDLINKTSDESIRNQLTTKLFQLMTKVHLDSLDVSFLSKIEALSSDVLLERFLLAVKQQRAVKFQGEIIKLTQTKNLQLKYSIYLALVSLTGIKSEATQVNFDEFKKTPDSYLASLLEVDAGRSSRELTK
jgi:hypothetical protein